MEALGLPDVVRPGRPGVRTGAQIGDGDEEGHEEAPVGTDDHVSVQGQALAKLTNPVPDIE